MVKKIAFILPVILLIFALVSVSACSAKPSAPPAPIGESSATKGVLNAPVTILIYSDFQCSACARADGIIDEILKKYPDKVYVMYRYFPLDGHPYSLLSAVAAECAKKQGKFWVYHDKLFQNQKEWAGGGLMIDLTKPENILSVYAENLGLNVEEFNRCLLSPETRKVIMESRKEGDLFQIMSTPTFFINNQRVVGINSLKARYDEIIQQELKKKNNA